MDQSEADRNWTNGPLNLDLDLDDYGVASGFSSLDPQLLDEQPSQNHLETDSVSVKQPNISTSSHDSFFLKIRRCEFEINQIDSLLTEFLGLAKNDHFEIKKLVLNESCHCQLGFVEFLGNSLVGGYYGCDISSKIYNIIAAISNIPHVADAIIVNPFLSAMLLSQKEYQNHPILFKVFLEFSQKNQASLISWCSMEFKDFICHIALDEAPSLYQHDAIQILDVLVRILPDSDPFRSNISSNPTVSSKLVSLLSSKDVIITASSVSILFYALKDVSIRAEIFSESNMRQLCPFLLRCVGKSLGSQCFRDSIFILLKSFRQHCLMSEKVLSKLFDNSQAIVRNLTTNESDNTPTATASEVYNGNPKFRFESALKIIYGMHQVGGISKDHALISRNLAVFDFATKEICQLFEEDQVSRDLDSDERLTSRLNLMLEPFRIVFIASQRSYLGNGNEQPLASPVNSILENWTEIFSKLLFHFDFSQQAFKPSFGTIPVLYLTLRLFTPNDPISTKFVSWLANHKDIKDILKRNLDELLRSILKNTKENMNVFDTRKYINEKGFSNDAIFLALLSILNKISTAIEGDFDYFSNDESLDALNFASSSSKDVENNSLGDISGLDSIRSGHDDSDLSVIKLKVASQAIQRILVGSTDQQVVEISMFALESSLWPALNSTSRCSKWSVFSNIISTFNDQRLKPNSNAFVFESNLKDPGYDKSSLIQMIQSFQSILKSQQDSFHEHNVKNEYLIQIEHNIFQKESELHNMRNEMQSLNLKCNAAGLSHQSTTDSTLRFQIQRFILGEETAKQSVENLSKENENLQSQLQIQKEQVKILEDEKFQVEIRLDDFVKENEQIKLKSQQDALELEELRMQISNLNEKHNSLLIDHQQLNGKVSELEVKLSTKENTISEKDFKIKELENEINAQKEYQEMVAQLASKLHKPITKASQE